MGQGCPGRPTVVLEDENELEIPVFPQRPVAGAIGADDILDLKAIHQRDRLVVSGRLDDDLMLPIAGHLPEYA